MKKITRTFQKHIISSGIFTVKEGKPHVEPLETFEIFNEPISQEKAIKLARKKFGKDLNLVVMDIITTEITYSMPVETFIYYADKENIIKPEE